MEVSRFRLQIFYFRTHVSSSIQDTSCIRKQTLWNVVDLDFVVGEFEAAYLFELGCAGAVNGFYVFLDFDGNEFEAVGFGVEGFVAGDAGIAEWGGGLEYHIVFGS